MPGFHDGALAVQRPMTRELINRVRALRRRASAPAGSNAPEEPTASRAPDEPPLERQVDQLRAQVDQLQAQVGHLEQLVQGFQDSVYRDARRHDEQITELQERIAPAALAAALSKDERERGL
jgi:uncharacterized protein YlxW (UPF0749 family)